MMFNKMLRRTHQGLNPLWSFKTPEISVTFKLVIRYNLTSFRILVGVQSFFGRPPVTLGLFWLLRTARSRFRLGGDLDSLVELADSAYNEAVVPMVESWILGIVMTFSIVRYSRMLIHGWIIFGPGTWGFELICDRFCQGGISGDDRCDSNKWQRIGRD
jgi:hypothetical protein